MVNARTYPLWRDLAMREDLPKEALKTVIGALCAPATTPDGFDAQADRWREEVLKAALPALLARTSAKRLRGQLLVQADEKTLAALAADGIVTAADVPAILRHRRVWAGLVSALALHPGQVEAAITLLPRLPGHEVEQVVRDWDPDRYTRTKGAAPAPPVPQELFDAVLEACLTPLAAYLLHPEPEEGWETVSSFLKDWSLELGDNSAWAMLARCPQRWAQLTAHPVFGAAVQHLLLDQAETQAFEDARLRAADPDGEELPADPAPALSEDLLLACLPALCLPELADLPNPQVTARRTLHHIANRVRSNPRLADLAADQLHAAADALVTRGQLLIWAAKQEGDHEFDGRVLRLAEDLALLSANPDHLAGACAQLARLDQPAVVSPTPSRTLIRIIDNTDSDHDRPARLLERHYEHRRVQALSTLAANPHTPHAAVTDVLNGLHPAELAWIAEKAGGPDWFLAAAAAVPVPEDEDDGVVRLLDDDELGKHPDPAAVLQSWLDSPATGEILSRSEVYRAVVKSRYRTLEHLRQIPADEILARHEPEVALKILLDHCGRSTDRWEALAAAMTFDYDDEKITFGQLLDSLDGAPAQARTS
ncbi:hypothetical protein AB0E64_39030 [Streptomyces caelestis]|uniref:Uncharacterized protein n=1 Tax=Streptomyces caelestis TaxID=36816 RepID=A0A7W9GXX0_9ACTN|nr:hypothetical protein [Streptomyces caelestis]MBB5792075.1 hypothetical protein [Streptomyces caelestis]GGW86352.1 hypothetical protein GCM10010320_80010 [Streptomyces caelestis]